MRWRFFIFVQDLTILPTCSLKPIAVVGLMIRVRCRNRLAGRGGYLFLILFHFGEKAKNQDLPLTFFFFSLSPL